MIPIEPITAEDFAPYGTVMLPDPARPWDVVAAEDSPGWRIALMRVGSEPVTRLERHPTSRESFEPLSGTAVLLVSAESPKDYRAFLLDAPVCLHKGVWHQITALAGEAVVKIVENKDVESEYFDFDATLHCGIEFE